MQCNVYATLMQCWCHDSAMLMASTCDMLIDKLNAMVMVCLSNRLCSKGISVYWLRLQRLLLRFKMVRSWHNDTRGHGRSKIDFVANLFPACLVAWRNSPVIGFCTFSGWVATKYGVLEKLRQTFLGVSVKYSIIIFDTLSNYHTGSSSMAGPLVYFYD